MVESALTDIKTQIELISFPTQGAQYYELKNQAVTQATGDIVVMLDSDAIPEPDWLMNLLKAFADSDIQVVGGNSYIEPTDTYSRAFALGWFFPLRAESGPVHRANKFYANNVAFRTEILRRCPLRSPPGANRGADHLLAEELKRSGIPIYRNPQARIAHPAPRLCYFAHRAIAHGRDTLLRRRFLSDSEPILVRDSIREAWRHMSRARRRIWRHGNRVQMKAHSVPLAMCIIAAYYCFFMVGDLLTRAVPRIMGRHFHV